MLGSTEGFGLVYVDAMRHGVPVIASLDDAGQEVNVDGLTGFNVSLTDSARLTEVLVRLLGNPDLARQIGDAGRLHWGKHYTFDAFKARFLKATSGFLGL
jgi:phosphatidylinositol alpha-1,6-mannosyltransferase